MNLIEEAVILEIFGIRVYAFGLYAGCGALCAVAVLAMMRKAFDLRKGTVPLIAFTAMLCGLICSRLFFCLLNQELGRLTPLGYWLQLSGGGWSMFGLIGGIFLGGWISAKISKQNCGKILDVLSLSILPMIAIERIGENRIESFDISRALDNSFLKNSFLVTGDYLATYYVASIVAVILFAVLFFTVSRRGNDGFHTIRFLLLFGASSIILESLRYDFFLSISFVGLQQVAAALMLGTGVVLSVVRYKRPKSVLSVCALISLPLMVCIIIALEFALDRTTWNKIIIYLLMILTVAVPAGMGLKNLNDAQKG